MEPKFKSQNYGIGLLALASVVMFSGKSVFAKMAYEYKVDPISVLYLRMLFSFPLVIIISYIYEKKQKLPTLAWKEVLQIAGISMLGYYFSSILNFVGLVYVEASIERLILFLYPTMVIVLSAIFMKKRITVKQIIAIVISYIGLLIAFADKLMFETSNAFWFGAFLIVLSSLTYAIFLTVSDNLISKVGSIRFTSIAILTMCLGVFVHAGVTGKAVMTGYDSNVYWYCGFMAIVSTVIPVYMFNAAISKMGASNVSVISCLGPICTLILSAFMLHEGITILQILGTFIVMIGIMFVYLNKKTINYRQ
jgi:drug/metabolite transporter (DMT)-like permease